MRYWKAVHFRGGVKGRRCRTRNTRDKTTTPNNSLGLFFFGFYGFFKSGFDIFFFSSNVFCRNFCDERPRRRKARKPRSSRETRDGEERKKRKPATRRAGPRRDSTTCASSDGTGACPTSPPRLAGVRQTSAKGRERTKDAAIVTSIGLQNSSRGYRYSS